MPLLRSAIHYCVVSACLSLAGIASAQAPDSMLVGDFSRAPLGNNPPAEWKPLSFKRIRQHTSYSVIKDEDLHVIKAESNHSASGLVNDVSIDLRDYPFIEWRWKVANLIDKGDPHEKAGDDYPARIYITFAQDQSKLSFADKIARKISGQDIPHSGLNYIWDNKTPINSILPNAYTDRLRMIVIQSGSDKLNQWQTETRNVLEDYRKAFGKDPPLISGVAMMTDTDNTGESATAWYGDIRFKKIAK
ncbi:MAG: hypothetical protein RL020_1418 [Pseudomonadota bacterium]|jgi:Protein of unknown function (DUF3047)